MKNVYILLFCLVAFYGCQTGGGGQIEALEKAFNEAPNQENAGKLVAAYEDFANNNPSDTEWSGRYLYRAASTYFRMNNFSKALSMAEKGAEQFSGSSVTPSALQLMEKIERTSYRRTDKADALAAGIIEKYAGTEQAKKVGEAYTGKKISEWITELKSFADTTKGRLDRRLANKLIGAYEAAYIVDPDGANSGDHLYNAGDIARSAGQSQKALKNWEKLYNKYPDHDKAAQVLFLQGFIYENTYRKMDSAQVRYEAFMERFPSHDLADDVKFSLENLGKTPDEIIKQFESKNK